jgi:hypothetical protein
MRHEPERQHDVEIRVTEHLIRDMDAVCAPRVACLWRLHARILPRMRQHRNRSPAERFVEEVRSDDPEIAAKPRIEERELEAGGLN